MILVPCCLAPSRRGSVRLISFTLLNILCSVPFLAQTGPGGSATLPNGRRVTPLGLTIQTAPYPFSIAVRPGDREVAVPSIGFPFALNRLRLSRGAIAGSAQPSVVVQQQPPGPKSDAAVQAFVGVAYSADGALLYSSTGDTGAIEIRNAVTLEKAGELSLNDSVYQQSFSGAITLSPDDKTLFVLDQANWRVVTIDLASRRSVSSFPTGVNPIALAVSPDGQRLSVANSGLFRYDTVPGVVHGDTLHTGLHFPPFGYPSRAAEEGILAEGKSVPGLGDPNDLRGSSLWTYTVAEPGKPLLRKPVLLSKVRLGAAIQAGVVGGAAPSAVVAGYNHIYVALAHTDSVIVLPPDGSRVEAEIALSPFTGPRYQDRQHRPLRGVMPSGLALSANRLFVAEAGINAVAVIDPSTKEVLGHIPAGWTPSAVALSQDGQQLFVVNTKGFGSGPNAGAHARPGAPTYVGQLEYGTVSILPAATAPDTAAVVRNNEAALAPETPSMPDRLPALRHVFLIIRENRTFDEVLGDLPGANGDPALARFGLRAAASPALENVSVTPNAHQIAKQFATSDAFFADSDVSADGHRWVLGIQPTPWLNIAWTSNYGGRRHADPFSKAPGRRALGGGNDAPMPEDEPEEGSLWEHVSAARLQLLNYGEGLELEGADEMDGAAPEGQRLLLNAPLPRPVFRATDRRYPTFNLGIPDQVRADEFVRDFGRRLRSGRLPSLIVIRLPNDHTAKPRPADGYPFKASYVADNDLALGRMLAFLSHSSIWSSSAVFVTEDDAQDGLDHVDAHRSVLFVASPYVKPGYVAHRRSDMGSINRTIAELLGLGSMNLEDALAPDLSEMFTKVPHTAPFTVHPADPRVFRPTKARIAQPKTAAEAAALRDCDDSAEIARAFHPARTFKHPAAAAPLSGRE